MSEETYYTILNVKESASPSEIKTAYREVIKQIHPDTIVNLAPYLRKMAEDKAKEINEAYAVLSSTSKRREYDRQLSEYRRPSPQSPTSQPPAGPTASTSFGYCNKCGTSLYASGFCPQCNNPTPVVRPKTVRSLEYAWARLIRFSNEHTYVVVFTVLAGLFYITWIVADKASQSTAQSDSKTPVTNNAAQAQAIPPPPPGFMLDEKPDIFDEVAKPTVALSGVYVGVVHNQTASLSSPFTVVIHQTKAGLLDGCIEVKAPLYGSGTLRGSVRGSHANFIVEDMTFQGDASNSAIAGSYVVSQQDGQQLGDFHLDRQRGAEMLYTCVNGSLIDGSRDR